MPEPQHPDNPEPDPVKDQQAKSNAAFKAAMDDPKNNAEAYDPLEWGWRQKQSRFN